MNNFNYLRQDNDYTNYLFKNGTLSNNDSDSLLSYNFNTQYGGAKQDNSKPNGGFPPLFECKTEPSQKKKNEKDKKKENSKAKIIKI